MGQNIGPAYKQRAQPGAKGSRNKKRMVLSYSKRKVRPEAGGDVASGRVWGGL